MATKLPSFEEDMDIIQKLGDTPGTDNNLSAGELKARFDKAGNLLKTYLNRIVPMINNVFSGDGNVITGGTLIGDLDMNGNRLLGVRAPTAEADAANKKYVDEAAEAVKKVTLSNSGGTVTGDIDMGGNALSNVKTPVFDTDGATKGYVDGKRKTFTATVGTGWTGSGPYTQTVAVSGILASDMPHVVPVYDADNTTAQAQREAWGCVSRGVAAAGGIQFTCFEDKPETAIPIQIEVMR